ncbi:hypothetical protein TRFO_42938 [Tritrichomonas foetus]|uniref:Uncharacterized protein n=1 Tax=Tritrichomonas foetus TaxID=1144522 RepID=A0A1J4KTM3_9EUKA|nr:hypothetical protein TRFO_42938 [Tritrichomonas foetus]|eukprot:OHT14615.1 hypothetical protein TRFO_42938 [Tritrichomonas foetus]
MWIRYNEFLDGKKRIYGIRLKFDDESKPDNVFILNLDVCILISYSTAISDSDECTTTRSSKLYLIKDDCSILITKSVTYQFPDFKVEIVKKSNYFKTYIHKLDNQHQYCIFRVFDGNNNFNSESNFDTKSLFCTSYSNHRMSNKFNIIHVALLCTINEFMNTILLDLGGNKRWTVERNSTIIRYINLNMTIHEHQLNNSKNKLVEIWNNIPFNTFHYFFEVNFIEFFYKM